MGKKVGTILLSSIFLIVIVVLLSGCGSICFICPEKHYYFSYNFHFSGFEDLNENYHWDDDEPTFTNYGIEVTITLVDRVGNKPNIKKTEFVTIYAEGRGSYSYSSYQREPFFEFTVINMPPGFSAGSFRLVADERFREDCCGRDERITEEYAIPFVYAPLVRNTLPPALVRNTLTPTPSVTPTNSYPGCPSNPPLATVLVNSFCRSGPSIAYDKLTSFTPGTQLPIAGYYRQTNGTIWWNVTQPGKKTDCWIFEQLVSVCIPIEDVSLLTPPPTPTPRPVVVSGGGRGLYCDPFGHTPETCGDGLLIDGDPPECDCSVLCDHFTDQASCEAHSTWYCIWDGTTCGTP
jgi:hypothetical protein